MNEKVGLHWALCEQHAADKTYGPLRYDIVSDDGPWCCAVCDTDEGGVIDGPVRFASVVFMPKHWLSTWWFEGPKRCAVVSTQSEIQSLGIVIDT